MTRFRCEAPDVRAMVVECDTARVAAQIYARFTGDTDAMSVASGDSKTTWTVRDGIAKQAKGEANDR